MNVNFFEHEVKLSNSFSVFFLFSFLNFFEIFFLNRILLSDFSLELHQLKTLFNSISEFSFTGTLRHLIKKNLMNFYKHRNQLFVNLSFKKSLCKNFYQKRPILTNVNENIRKENYPFFSKKEIENPFFFLLHGVGEGRFKGSIQFVLILKHLGFLETDWNAQLIRVSRYGLKILFENPDKQLLSILNKLDRKKKEFYEQIFSTSKGFYSTFQKKIFIRIPKKDRDIFDKWKDVCPYSEFFYRFHSDFNKKEKIAHCFFR